MHSNREIKGRGLRGTEDTGGLAMQAGKLEVQAVAAAAPAAPRKVTLKIRLLFVNLDFFLVAASEARLPRLSVRFFCRFCKI